MNFRRYLLLLVLGLERCGWEQTVSEAKGPIRMRINANGRPKPLPMKRPRRDRAAGA
jgi:hypothetical protein